jgi:hypothetical protein
MMRAVFIGASKDPNAKITILLVPLNGASPTLAIKVPTTPFADSAVDSEGKLLAEIHRGRSFDVLNTIPQVRGVLTHGEFLAMVTTAVPGVPITTSYLRWRHTAARTRVEADLGAVERWLARFQEGTSHTRAALDMGDVAGRLERRFAGDRDLATVLAGLDAVLCRLRRTSSPRTAVHGDFWPGNVLLSGGEVSGVVDWEAGSTSGEPVRDLVRFALMYSLYLDCHTGKRRRVAGHSGLRAEGWGAGIRHGMDGSGWFPELFQRFLRNGLGRLGADPACWRDAALAGLAEVAATTDHATFARLHLDLFRALAESKPR